MKRIFFLIAMLLLVLPQIPVWSVFSPYKCCTGQLGLDILGVASASGYVNVLVSEAKQMIESNPTLIILDVRSKAEYDSGHLQNATLIPHTELAGRLDELDKQKDILVYCGVGGRSANASQTLVDNGFPGVYNMLGGITSWKSAGYWIEIIHDGDLNVSGSQIYTIENCSYVQTGNIVISGNGQLIIRNSELLARASPGESGLQILVSDSARMTIEGSELKNSGSVYGEYHFTEEARLISVRSSFTSAQAGFYLEFHDSSVGNFTMTQLNTCLCIAVSDHSNVVVTNSSGLVNSFEATQLRVQVTTADLRITDQTASEHIRYFNSDLNWTIVEGFAGDLTVVESDFRILLVPCDNSNVTVTDSAFFAIVERGHSGTPTPANNTIYILNSTVQEIQVNAGSTVLIVNSRVGYYLGEVETFLTVSDSRDMFLNLQDSTAVIENSTISGLSLRGNLFAQRLTDIYLFGNVSFSSESPVTIWENATAIREFSFLVTDRSDFPMYDVELDLYDEYGFLTWTGITDSFGEAKVNVTYIDANWTDTLTLEAIKGDLSAATNVSLLSDTPVKLALFVNTTGDVNGDSRVDMKDVSYVARRFMCSPSDPLWDPVADLNGDGRVDMKDISTVARHFGEHDV